MPAKQVIVIRKDLKMRRGKEIAQGAHAAMAFLTERLRRGTRYLLSREVSVTVPLSLPEREWVDGIFTKVCVRVDSEQALLDIERRAKEVGVICHIITDSGLTEFQGQPTMTCLAVGPDEDEKIDRVTGHLELY